MTTPPTDNELLAYAAGELPDDDAARVEAHLRTHPDAARTVATYRLAADRVAADDGVEPPAAAIERARAVFRVEDAPGWLERLENAVARLVFDSRVQTAAVRVAPGAGSFELGFETDDAEIDLRAERTSGAADTDGDERWRLSGQVSASAPLDAVEVAVLRAGTDDPILTARADDRSFFRLDDLAPGSYDLRFDVNGVTVIVSSVDVR
jgi:anti-sigma factor RsiW